jgi:hypothetical protein
MSQERSDEPDIPEDEDEVTDEEDQAELPADLPQNVKVPPFMDL